MALNFGQILFLSARLVIYIKYYILNFTVSEKSTVNFLYFFHIKALGIKVDLAIH